jgi:hypothetical protein
MVERGHPQYLSHQRGPTGNMINRGHFIDARQVIVVNHFYQDRKQILI